MSKNPDDWMWQRARDLLDEADRLQRHFFRPVGAEQRRHSWEPPVDVFETPGEVWVLVALPGVEPERVHATLEGQELIVAGARRMPPALRRAVVDRLEIPHGRFERCVPLPEGRFELADRKLENGCMVIMLRKVF